MQIIEDPQIYETSDIVEKSSKTGFFSNKRLLVIKNGFLYYFSNVPKGYKKHIPNILDNLQQLPKSSIEIKSIHTIKLESAKSSDLIIKFYQKDMIDRQDIRKSISKGGFQKNQKNTQDLQEWKFTFTTVLQCRLWYTALVKLKQHFNKQEDKIQQFFNNFDPVRRISKIITNVSTIKNEDSKGNDFSSSQIKNQKPNNFHNQNPQQAQLFSSSYQQTFKVKVQQHSKAETQTLKIKAQQKRQETVKQKAQQKSKLQTSSKISYDLKTITQEDQDIKQRKLQQEIRKQIADQIRHEQRNRAEKHIQIYKSKIEEKQSQLMSLQKKLQDQKKSRTIQKQDLVMSLRSSPSLTLSPQKKKVSVNQLSIQTDQQEKYDLNLKKQISTKENNQKQQIKDFHQSVQCSSNNIQNQNQLEDKKLRHSAVTQLDHQKRETVDTINLFRNTVSYIPPKTFRISQKEQQSYDYYDQIGVIYQKQTKFEQQSKRQLRLIKYISHLKRQASQTFQKYINQMIPQKSVTIQRGKFQLLIVWSSGKIINLQEGVEKLVFQSKQHQLIKRKWKLYNFLQNRLISILRKKPSFSLRVPLCFHAQYCGYSALIQIIPNCKNNPELKNNPVIQKQILALVGQHNSFRFSIKEIKNRSKQLFLIQVDQPYKVTSMDEKIPVAEYSYDIPSLIKSCRMNNISTCSNKIKAQIFERQGKGQSLNSIKEQQIRSLQYIKLCRQLKNLLRSTQPQSIIDSSFFKAFLLSPEPIISLLSDESVQYWAKVSQNPKGQLLSYLSFFFGIHLSYHQDNFDIMSNIESIKIQHYPVVRSFDLQKTSVIQISSNFQKYLKQGKKDLTQTALSFRRQIQQDPITSQLQQASLMIQDGQFSKAIQKLLKIKQTIPFVDLRYMKCSAFLIECYQKCNLSSEMLRQLSSSMDYTDFMFGKNSNQKAFLYLLTAEILIKQNKVQQGIRVYRELLQRYTSVINREDLYISLTKSLVDNQNADPDHLIEFIRQFISPNQTKDSQYFVKQTNKIQDPKNEKQAALHKHLGCLYKSSKNNQKAAAYLESSLKYYLQQSDTQNQRLSNLEAMQHWNSLIQIGIELTKCYINPQTRLKTFIKLINVSNHLIKQNQLKNPNAVLSIGVQNAIKNLYTSYFCEIVSANLNSDQQELLRGCINEIEQKSVQGNMAPMPISREFCLKEDQIRFIISETLSQKMIPFEYNRQFYSCFNLKDIQSLLITLL